jgi:hypothetical protein
VKAIHHPGAGTRVKSCGRRLLRLALAPEIDAPDLGHDLIRVIRVYRTQDGTEEMNSMGPNEPCICGSGEKFKKCCGAQIAAEPSGVEARPKLSVALGLPGMPTFVHIKAMSKSNPDDPRNRTNPGGSPGQYKVTFVLSKPDYAPTAERLLSFLDDLEGDSHLFVGLPGEVKIELDSNLNGVAVKLRGVPNARGHLGGIVADDIKAENFADANLKAHNAVSIILSRLSLLADVPLHIFRMISVELAANNHMSTFTTPVVEKQLNHMSEGQVDDYRVKFGSLYREGMNSNSPNYQFLCFYKVIEGIRRIQSDRTAKLNIEAKAKGEAPVNQPRDVLPSSRDEQIAWLDSVFWAEEWGDIVLAQVFQPEAAGRKVNEITASSGVLDTVRNRIAHSVLRDEALETILIDQGLHINDVSTWLPLCKCLARFLMKKEFPDLFA